MLPGPWEALCDREPPVHWSPERESDGHCALRMEIISLRFKSTREATGPGCLDRWRLPFPHALGGGLCLPLWGLSRFPWEPGGHAD